MAIRCTWAAIVLFAGGQDLFAQTADRIFRVDFGINSQQTTATGWNNVAGQFGLEPIKIEEPLVASDGVFRGHRFSNAWSHIGDDTGIAGPQANYEGPYPQQLGDISPSALRDSLYVRDGTTFTFIATQLNPNAVYDFMMYAAAGNTGDRSRFTVDGANSGQADILQIVNNNDEVAIVTGIVPDANRRIRVQLEGRRPDGSPHILNVNNDAQGRLNYLQMIERPVVPGDYNGDGVVSASDYNTWRSTFGSTANLAADGNRNGVVDAGDYVLWRNAMNAAASGGSGSSLAYVPEPASALLAIMGLFALCGARRNARRTSIR